MIGLFEPDVARFLNVVRLLLAFEWVLFESEEAEELPETIGHTRPRVSLTFKKFVLLVWLVWFNHELSSLWFIRFWDVVCDCIELALLLLVEPLLGWSEWWIRWWWWWRLELFGWEPVLIFVEIWTVSKWWVFDACDWSVLTLG